MKTPVAFIFFNRPAQTLKTLSRILDYQPPVIYLIADGPREGKPHEKQIVEELRSLVIRECRKRGVVFEIRFADFNLGCATRVSTGISSVLSDHEFAIVMEDDCLPSQDFFRYVDHFKDKYASNKKIACLSGSCLSEKIHLRSDHGLTYYPVIWGWALWRRAWKDYNLNLDDIHTEDLKYLETDGITDENGVKEWSKLLNAMKRNPKYTWDAQFVLRTIAKRMMAVHPSRNLISNIGFGQGATHTTERFHRFSLLDSKTWNPDRFQQGELDLRYSRYLETEFFHDVVTWRNLPYRCARKAELIIRKIISRENPK